MPKNSLKLYPLQKSVLVFKNKAAEFLNAYTTNTPDAEKNAFVDIRGRIIATCDQKRIGDDEILIAVEKPFRERLIHHLDNYLKLGDTKVLETPGRLYFDLEAKKVIFTSDPFPADVSEEAFKLFRLKNKLPVQGIDYDGELLLTVGDEEFVSYTKGCYLGQEIIARVHYRSRPPKKLVVKTKEELLPGDSPMTSAAVDPETGKTIGFVFTVVK